MGFRDGAFATVWEITNQGENFTKIRMSTSRKDKKTDEYVTDFSGFVSLIGNANKSVGQIENAIRRDGRCRIKMGACDVSNSYDKEAGREYVNYTLFDFELADAPAQNDNGGKQSGGNKKKGGKPTGKKKSPPPPALDEDDEDEDEALAANADDDDLPF